MRFKRSLVALFLFTGAVVIPACASDQLLLPKKAGRGPAGSGAFEMIPGRAIDATRNSTEYTSAVIPCTDASPACTSVGISRPSDWVFRGNTYMVALSGTAQLISTNGVARVLRGYWSLVAEPSPLACNKSLTRECVADTRVPSTCSSEMNQASMATKHFIKVPDYMPGIADRATSDSCDGPRRDEECGSGGSDDGDEWETSKGASRRANFGCEGGGDDPPQLYCTEEWIRIEISYDGGATWQTLWEGWGDICDLAEL